MINTFGRVIHQAQEHMLFNILNYKSIGKHYLILHHKDCVDGIWGATLAEEMFYDNNNKCEHQAYQYVETPQIKIDPRYVPDFIVTVDMSPNDADIKAVTEQYPNIVWLITDHHDDQRVERISEHAKNNTNINVVFSKFLGGSYLLKALFYAVNGIYYQNEMVQDNKLSTGETPLSSHTLEQFLYDYLHVDNHYGDGMYRDITYYVGFRDIWLERSQEARDINKIIRNIVMTNPNPIETLRSEAAIEMDLLYIHRPFEKFSPSARPNKYVQQAYNELIRDFIHDHNSHISDYYQSGIISCYQVAETDFVMATNLSEVGAGRKLKFAVGTIPTTFVSDISEVLYSSPFKGHEMDFVLTVMPSITGDYMYLSLRSRNPTGTDLLALLPKLFGEGVGGGHKHAAGGRISYDQGVKFLRSLNIIAR